MDKLRYPQLFLEEIDTPSVGTVSMLNPADSHHLLTVLRLKPGDILQVVVPKAKSSYLAQISSIIDASVQITLTEKIQLVSTRSPVASLTFASLKSKNNPLVIEKATELGVSKIILFNSERSVKNLDVDDNNLHLRLNKVIKAAASQSNKNFLPELFICGSIQAASEIVKKSMNLGDQLYCASLQAKAIPARELKGTSGPCHLIIGPEGDFSENEYNFLSSSNWKHVSLSPFVLRSETAAIAGVSMLSVLLDQE
ncbi:MAG: RsmE family RNA methyltransferase [Bdellovibrionota bacterium]